jgi:glycosyltransferase involved in cell wall biosynthesis
MLHVYFEAFSVLTTYNLDLPMALAREGVNVTADVKHPLLFAQYVYDKFRRRYGLRMLPPYINVLFRTRALKRSDVVHLNSPDLNIAKVARKHGKPVIMVLHTAPLSKELYDQLSEYVDVYIAPSNFTRMQEHSKTGSKRIIVINHGVDTELFNPSMSREIARKKLNVPLEAKVILWNDRISPEKDLGLFLDALELVFTELKDAFVYIKGRGVVDGYYEQVKDKMIKMRKSGRVKIHIGWIPHNKLPLLYRASDVFVRTSKHENFGLAAIESMACATPVVAPNHATFPEILGRGDTLFNPGSPQDLAEKVIKLLTDGKLYERVVSYQLARAHNLFNLNAIARRYVDLYKSLVSSLMSGNVVS